MSKLNTSYDVQVDVEVENEKIKETTGMSGVMNNYLEEFRKGL